MATITFEVPDESLPLITAAFTDAYGYRAKLPDGKDNSVTPGMFTVWCVAEHVKAVCRAYLTKTAHAAATEKIAADIATQVDAVPIKATVT